MSDNVLLIGIILIMAAGLLCGVLLRLVFKQSIVFKIGAVFLAITDIIACFAFIVGSRGITHLVWAVPVSILLLFFGYYWLSFSVQKPIQSLTDNIHFISEGKLSVRFNGMLKNRSDELGQISVSVGNLVERIRDVIGNVHESSDILLSNSSQIRESSQQLSSGANQQASAAEEVSSSIEEMVSVIHQNTENSQSTEQISNEAAKNMKTVTHSAVQSVDQMNEVAKEVTIIQDIAFQTNILALNAAVEAARAGNHGKGFAVVAAEVRRLAERSKVAAEKIENITKNGVTSISEVEQRIKMMLPEIEKTAQLVLEISASSNEQSSGADQINNAIQELNTVTQTTASAAEELANSAEDLNSQSEHLKKLMNYFEL
jgi:methyl-accepting chemotaxis protein